MKREEIIVELKYMGYDAVMYDAVKNGVLYEGITIRTEDSRISPVFYPKMLMEMAEKGFKSARDVALALIELYEADQTAGFDPSDFLNREYALSHMKIGLQKKSSQDLVKCDSEFEGIEKYLYVTAEESEDGMYSLNVTEEYLNEIRVSESKAWERAAENTFSETQIKDLEEMLRKIPGMGVWVDETAVPGFRIYCISNRNGIRGAAAICDREKIKTFFQWKGIKKIVVFPSSIHEMLAIPYDDSVDMEGFHEMVRMINVADVAPEERLTDRAYIMEL